MRKLQKTTHSLFYDLHFKEVSLLFFIKLFVILKSINTLVLIPIYY